MVRVQQESPWRWGALTGGCGGGHCPPPLAAAVGSCWEESLRNAPKVLAPSAGEIDYHFTAMLLTFTSDLRAPPQPLRPPAAHPALGCSAVPSPTAVCTAQPSPSPAPIPHPSCIYPASSPAPILHPALLPSCIHPATSSAHIQHSSCIKPCSHPLPFPHPSCIQPCSHPAPILILSRPKSTGGGGRRAGCRMGAG